ncbi:MAG TPA: FliH/SctL family protein [Pseudolabrys sp.]|jgi:flagellar assembly protein FliH|nr:FliH/SctL family protein [Pseudolabrys sp.]
MKTAAKYLFDEDFAGGGKPTITLVEAERRRADAESIAYRNGFAAGQAQAQAEIAQNTAAALAVIADGLDRIHRALGNIEARLESEAVEVAVAVAGKLAPELIAREPFAEISALATECFRHLVKTPHVSVRISADLYAAGKDKLQEIAQARGFEGRLVVQPDASLAPGDCRIEWSEGGVNRDQAAMFAAIDDVVGRYVAARTATTH